MQCKIKIHDEVYCTIYGLNEKTNSMLWDKFGPFVDGHRFMPAFKLGRWDGRIRFYEKTGKTYVNLLFDIIPLIEQIGYEIELEDNRLYFDEGRLHVKIVEDMYSRLRSYIDREIIFG